MPETPKEHWEYTIKEWESGQFRQLLDKLPDKIGVVYDIGANVGGFSHVIHARFPDAKIYCFEPIENNYKSLSELQYVKAFKKGIYYGAKESRATWRGSNIGAYFLEQVDSGEPRIFSGEMLELEELENFNIEKPQLVKLDVEGAEENILQHSKIIKECEYVIVEWHPDHVDPFSFFDKFLPKHKILFNIDNKQFLLCLK